MCAVHQPNYTILPRLKFRSPLGIVAPDSGGAVRQDPSNFLDAAAFSENLAGQCVPKPVWMASVYVRPAEYCCQGSLCPFDKAAHTGVAAYAIFVPFNAAGLFVTVQYAHNGAPRFVISAAFIAHNAIAAITALRPAAKTTSQLRLDGVVPGRQRLMAVQS